jgi:hypothetical protein
MAMTEIQELSEFIRDHLPTKDDVRTIVRDEVATSVPGIVAFEIKPMRQQLGDIEKQLDALAENYKNLKGVTKEIDEIRAEVRAIQKHLGIEKKIAA